MYLVFIFKKSCSSNSLTQSTFIRYLLCIQGKAKEYYQIEDICEWLHKSFIQEVFPECLLCTKHSLSGWVFRRLGLDHSYGALEKVLMREPWKRPTTKLCRVTGPEASCTVLFWHQSCQKTGCLITHVRKIKLPALKSPLKIFASQTPLISTFWFL